MKEFLLVFRRDIRKEAQPSPEQMQASVKHWQDWIGSIAAQNRLAKQPQRWSADARVVRSGNLVTDGPYAEIKEAIGGMLFIKAADFDDAAEIAKGCPILQWGGNVEIRMAISPEEADH